MSAQKALQGSDTRELLVVGKEKIILPMRIFLQKSNGKENELLIRPNVDLADGPELLDGDGELRKRSFSLTRHVSSVFERSLIPNLPVNVSNTAHPGSGGVSGLLETVRCQFS